MNFPTNFPQPNEIFFKASLEVLENIKANNIMKVDILEGTIKRVSKSYKINTIPQWVINWTYNHQDKIEISKEGKECLMIKKVRSASGIVSVSVFTKPYPCPGTCIFCPTEKNIPKSYLSNEPAVMRAVRNKYDPVSQIKSRLDQLQYSGHNLDKIELIIQGGTFSNLPRKYRESFVTACFAAVNGWPEIPKKNSFALLEEQENNEKAENRIIGLTIETRPDWINEEETKFLRALGVTRIELGVQSINDNVLELNKRGHTAHEVVKATKLLKDAGFKVCYHMMPGLPGSTLQDDMNGIKELFLNPAFKPDLLKIYPCVVTKLSELENWYQKGKFQPIGDRDLEELLIEIKKHVPPYVRIQRLGRDIPATDIIAGSKISNIRQKILSNKKVLCYCVRCREVKNKAIVNPKLRITKYEASKGMEYFLEYINKDDDTLYSLLRLRIPSEDTVYDVIKDSAIIREVHTYGKQIQIGKDGDIQHQGFGKLLIQKAEEIAKENGLKKITVISGIGARDYYSNLGYHLDNTYMIKEI
ncbi:TPA: tRNA uridine(34) 5-carboxymethylaminomethyl modification radical SAM/GNAT enzyme Elp3 [candidate division CPR2 bacterium]|uniref:tRNA carboxymethyluridine synthase n=1 Tax=candidate division CPR2 bacterium GW2011_GWC1_41_48 TaxID=1618344 RepID=A0A0G0WCE2_UNCC2|nr:MAG: Histone acetyltransferase, ELP3 family [candidate division CPR2 bacterium GW2011_GWC2_39_35]KKR28579.1 MAG: Histone acetyltransferase, ELP3 family [candidate division CPR2 bacterium GW2011_GWD2_39_7]KKR29623.1 MAG: Histone acetyltransferase, ELP3 family [candidate division CPR2 bacterium GW2011_GWD1_39_7]KKS09717.1 MAG: histone acetyltransferase, ELP3 family, elongator complex protein 3 [candidate division CPR2 bacterium GW2011_GWC1_41_48]OGB56509.1 MAG: hypothetical protein A2Y27_01240